MDTNDKYRRISKITAVLMTIVAVVFDLLELLVDWIPVAGQVIAFLVDVLSLTSFTLWFMVKGVSLGSPKAAARFWLTNIGELLPIPVIDFCLTTLGIILTIKMAWDEDSGEQSVVSAVTSAAQTKKKVTKP